MENQRLTCYAITDRALQIVLGEEARRMRIPEGWFNWVGIAPTQQDAYAPQRLELVRFAGRGESIARWCANAHAAGYACALIASIDDDFQLEDVRGLRGDVAFCPVTPSPLDAQEHRLLHQVLREPEEALVAWWVAVKLGGGADINKVGFANVTPAQWWAYGQGLRDWSCLTAKGKAEACLRENTPDFSRWAWMDGVPAAQLDLQWCWNGRPESTWPWSLDKPCTRTEIPTLETMDLVAYWPIRQMPCCGVARRRDGRLVTVGVLTDDWAWDAKGHIRDAISKAWPAVVKPDAGSLLHRKLLDFFPFKPGMLEGAAATERTTALPSTPKPPYYINWQESHDDHIVRVRLIANDEHVVLELLDPLPAITSPVAIRLRKPGKQWPLQLQGERWIVEGLKRQDVENICRRYCAAGQDGQRFVTEGYELVLLQGDKIC